LSPLHFGVSLWRLWLSSDGPITHTHMKQITEYKTARGSNIEELDAKVNELIQQGFQPFGSPYLAQGDDSLTCYRALVRFGEESAS
jgi:Domain of unknown function (DUF1737)